MRYAPRPPVAHKLDRYQPMILARLTEYPMLSATRILEEVRAAGYAGGYTQLKDYVRKIRPGPPPDPVVRFETPPGLQAQVDFAEFRLPWGKRYRPGGGAGILTDVVAAVLSAADDGSRDARA